MRNKVVAVTEVLKARCKGNAIAAIRANTRPIPITKDMDELFASKQKSYKF